MGADAMREAYAVRVARAVHFWTDIGRLQDARPVLFRTDSLLLSMVRQSRRGA
jgi:hypothetical protein